MADTTIPADPQPAIRSHKLSLFDTLLLILGVTCIAGVIVAVFSYESLVGRVRRLQATDAALHANQAVMQMALGDTQQALDYDATVSDALCATTGDRTMGSAFWRYCADTPGSWIPADRKFNTYYFNAVYARMAGDDKAALEAYQAALALKVVPQNVLRAREGLGYSQMHLGLLDQADQIIQQARAMPENRLFVFADITDIKLACARHDSVSVVTSKLQTLRARFDGLTRDRSLTAPERTCATRDRTAIERDDELFYDCAAYGIKAMPVSAPTQSC